MAQALENVNVSQNLGKMFSFAQKMVILFQNCFLAKSGFLKSLGEKSNPLSFYDKSLCNKPQYYPIVTTSPAERAARSAEVLRSSGTGKRN